MSFYSFYKKNATNQQSDVLIYKASTIFDSVLPMVASLTVFQHYQSQHPHINRNDEKSNIKKI